MTQEPLLQGYSMQNKVRAGCIFLYDVMSGDRALCAASTHKRTPKVPATYSVQSVDQSLLNMATKTSSLKDAELRAAGLFNPAGIPSKTGSEDQIPLMLGNAERAPQSKWGCWQQFQRDSPSQI
jgi:hypothetical protein